MSFYRFFLTNWVIFRAIKGFQCLLFHIVKGLSTTQWSRLLNASNVKSILRTKLIHRKSIFIVCHFYEWMNFSAKSIRSWVVCEFLIDFEFLSNVSPRLGHFLLKILNSICHQSKMVKKERKVKFLRINVIKWGKTFCILLLLWLFLPRLSVQ